MEQGHLRTIDIHDSTSDEDTDSDEVKEAEDTRTVEELLKESFQSLRQIIVSKAPREEIQAAMLHQEDLKRLLE